MAASRGNTFCGLERPNKVHSIVQTYKQECNLQMMNSASGDSLQFVVICSAARTFCATGISRFCERGICCLG